MLFDKLYLRIMRNNRRSEMDDVTRRIRGDKRNSLSPAMIRALQHAAGGDTRLNYMPHKKAWASIKNEPVASTTLRALERRGYLSPVGKQSVSGWPRSRKLTQKANAFLAGLKRGLSEKDTDAAVQEIVDGFK